METNVGALYCNADLKRTGCVGKRRGEEEIFSMVHNTVYDLFTSSKYHWQNRSKVGGTVRLLD